MENYVFDDEESGNKKPKEEEEEQEDLMNFEDEEEVKECAECGTAVKEEKKVVKEIDGEEYTFCSAQCAKEFEETLASTEEEE